MFVDKEFIFNDWQEMVDSYSYHYFYESNEFKGCIKMKRSVADQKFQKSAFINVYKTLHNRKYWMWTPVLSASVYILNKNGWNAMLPRNEFLKLQSSV